MDTVCLALGLDFSATVAATDSFDGPARGASKDFVGFLSADLSEATDIGFDRAMSEKMEDKIIEQSDKIRLALVTVRRVTCKLQQNLNRRTTPSGTKWRRTSFTISLFKKDQIKAGA